MKAADIPRAKNEELLELAKQRISGFPLLKSIYNDDFILKLVKNKHDLDNILLYWLVGDNPFSQSFFQEIENNLEILQPEGSVQTFGNKLKQWGTIPFESTIPEIDLAAEYKRRGYQIEFEPVLPNGHIGEFVARKDSLHIYFEVKRRFPERFMEENTITDEFLYRLEEFDEPFRLGIELKKSFHREHTVGATKYIRNKLRQLVKMSVELPYSFNYIENGETLAIITIYSRLPKGEKGYISGFNLGGEMIGDWSDLRNWISSAMDQLHPEHPGVLAIQPYGLKPSRYDIENALLGDLRASGYRVGDSILSQREIKRLSVVIFIERRLQELGYTRKKFVYHNLHANTKLSPEIFEGEDVTQLIPKQKEHDLILYEEITGLYIKKAN